MKKLFVTLSVALLFAACQSSPEGEKAETSETKEVAAATGATYKADLAGSMVGFVGTKPVGTHTGEFKLSSGEISVENGNITAGSFVIDVNSLKITDKDTAFTGKLTGHLLSEDFFKTTQYPTAKFEITSVTPFVADSTQKDILMKDATHTISGNLTLKDSTKNISFPAKITVDSSSVAATADFNIDRTLWGMNYKGPGNPQDWFISKTVNLKLTLTAAKK